MNFTEFTQNIGEGYIIAAIVIGVAVIILTKKKKKPKEAKLRLPLNVITAVNELKKSPRFRADFEKSGGIVMARSSGMYNKTANGEQVGRILRLNIDVLPSNAKKSGGHEIAYYAFVISHELGHYVMRTSNELVASNYAKTILDEAGINYPTYW